MFTPDPDREIQDTPSDLGAVKLLGEFFEPPFTVDPNQPGHGDVVWRQIAMTFYVLRHRLDEAIKRFEQANSPEGKRAHQLAMNVWFFIAEGEELAAYG